MEAGCKPGLKVLKPHVSSAQKGTFYKNTLKEVWSPRDFNKARCTVYTSWSQPLVTAGEVWRLPRALQVQSRAAISNSCFKIFIVSCVASALSCLSFFFLKKPWWVRVTSAKLLRELLMWGPWFQSTIPGS